jgi:serine phosphatase RsbU (regulator of sigma subunit)
MSSSPAQLPGHKAAGLCSMFGVPVYVDGELFGVLECGWTEERVVDEAEAAMVQLGAERIALAIGQARLYERSRTSQRYSVTLNEINTLLNASFEIEPMLDDVLKLAFHALHADAGVYTRLTPQGWTVEHAVGLRPRDTYAPEEQVAAPEVSASGGDGAAALGWMERTFRFEDRVVAMVPVRHAPGGAIMFGRRHARGFDDLAHDFVSRLAQSLALALTNVAHFEAEHHIAETLQEALLLMPPAVRGIEFAHLYRSATLSTRVGGDFFDIFEMAGGRVGILVGDVSGKGLQAAVLTSIIKDTIRAYAHETPSPADAIAKANIALGEAAKLPDFASVFFAVIDTREGQMTYCNAGHPPAAVVGAGIPVRLLEGNSAVIGAFPDLTYSDTTIHLGARECVLLYTDGVTEARNSEGRFFAEEGLLETLEKMETIDVSTLPGVVFDAVLSFTGGHLSDDTALLAFCLAPKA